MSYPSREIGDPLVYTSCFVVVAYQENLEPHEKPGMRVAVFDSIDFAMGYASENRPCQVFETVRMEVDDMAWRRQ